MQQNDTTAKAIHGFSVLFIRAKFPLQNWDLRKLWKVIIFFHFTNPNAILLWFYLLWFFHHVNTWLASIKFPDSNETFGGEYPCITIASSSMFNQWFQWDFGGWCHQLQCHPLNPTISLLWSPSRWDEGQPFVHPESWHLTLVPHSLILVLIRQSRYPSFWFSECCSTMWTMWEAVSTCYLASGAMLRQNRQSCIHGKSSRPRTSTRWVVGRVNMLDTPDQNQLLSLLAKKQLKAVHSHHFSPVYTSKL